MSESMPWTLLLAWVLFFGFLNSQQRHAANFKGASQGALAALHLSLLVGLAVGLGLLVYYFTLVAWYWPIILFVVGSVVAGLAFGLLDAAIGSLSSSMLAFVGWPSAAAWFFLIVRGIH